MLAEVKEHTSTELRDIELICGTGVEIIHYFVWCILNHIFNWNEYIVWDMLQQMYLLYDWQLYEDMALQPADIAVCFEFTQIFYVKIIFNWTRLLMLYVVKNMNVY